MPPAFAMLIACDTRLPLRGHRQRREPERRAVGVDRGPDRAETLDSPAPDPPEPLQTFPPDGMPPAARRAPAPDEVVAGRSTGRWTGPGPWCGARSGGGLRGGCGGGLLGGDAGVLGGLPRGLRVDGGLLGCGDAGDERAQRPQADVRGGQRGADGRGRAGEGCPGCVARVRDGGEGGVRVVDGGLRGGRRGGAAALVRGLGDDDVGAALGGRVAGRGEHVLVHAQPGGERLGLGLLRPLLGGVDATACRDGEHDAGGEADPDGPTDAGPTAVRREPAAARRGATVRRGAAGRRATARWVRDHGCRCTDHRRPLARDHDRAASSVSLTTSPPLIRPRAAGAPPDVGTCGVRLEARCRIC